MSNIFIKELQIKNFRCFRDEQIKLRVPDGNTEGSGLNILIGENGNGKTTVLEAINFLTQNRYSSENKLTIGDFNNHEELIDIKSLTGDFKCQMQLPYRGYFECNGFEFKAECRNRKAPGKLLSSPYQISNSFVCMSEHYKKEDGEDSGKEIPSLSKVYNNGTIIDDELNVFYFDKNRTRQITTGNYKTTFDKICDDLNWKFVKEYKNCDDEKKKSIIKGICSDYIDAILELTQKGVGGKISGNLKDFFNNDDYSNLRVDLLNLLHPYSNAFFALRKEDELKQINTKNLGSGIEIVLTLLLLNSIAGESKGSIIYLIDEPELHLHPSAQEKMLELLLKESKDKQIIISTHSPYMFKKCLLQDVGLLLFKRNDGGEIKITNANKGDWGLFRWSPSWGEINYHAYNLPTVEFHNELYGYLQELSDKSGINEFDSYLQTKQGISETRNYIFNGKPLKITLCTYVRNQIHHPDNNSNVRYTDSELRKSIEILINAIKNKEHHPESETVEDDIPF